MKRAAAASEEEEEEDEIETIPADIYQKAKCWSVRVRAGARGIDVLCVQNTYGGIICSGRATERAGCTDNDIRVHMLWGVWCDVIFSSTKHTDCLPHTHIGLFVCQTKWRGNGIKAAASARHIAKSKRCG